MPRTSIDQAALASLDKKLLEVEDWVTAVATGHQTGLYLFGTGGIGKTFNVLKRLDELEVSYKRFNSRMTAKGLFTAMRRAPDAIHVLEDLERLTSDRDAQSVLRAALWQDPGRDRIVTWTTATEGEQQFVFRGGLVMTANRPLKLLPELQALASRIIVCELRVTDEEVIAKMRRLAAEGYKIDGKMAVEPAQCADITEHLIRECRSAACPLHMRLQVVSYRIYMQWERHQTRCAWRDLVASLVREAAHHFREEVTTLSQEERIAADRQLVREILRETDDAEEQWQRFNTKTGRGRSTFFNRKREVQGGAFDQEDGS
jgi:hypothetical protein